MALTWLVSFNVTNGCFRVGGLSQGTDGGFYGTAGGGAHDQVNVFRISADGVLTTIPFDGTNGCAPVKV